MKDFDKFEMIVQADEYEQGGFDNHTVAKCDRLLFLWRQRENPVAFVCRTIPVVGTSNNVAFMKLCLRSSRLAKIPLFRTLDTEFCVTVHLYTHHRTTAYHTR